MNFSSVPRSHLLKRSTRPVLFILGLWLGFSALAYAEDVQRLLTEGKADLALAALNNRIQANAGDSEAHNLLCRVYYQQELWDKAASECQRAASLLPGSSRNQLWLGRAMGKKAEHSSFVTAAGLAPKVRVAFEHAVQLAPEDMAARADLSEYYIEAPGFMGGGIDKAEAEAANASRYNIATAHLIRAHIAEHLHQPELAESEYKKAVQESSEPAPHLFDLAAFYYRRQRLDEMEETMNRMAAASIKNGPELFDAGGLLLRAGRNFPGAIMLLRKYLAGEDIREDSPAFQAHYRLGVLLEKSGDVSGAIAAYKNALELASNYAPAQAALRHLQRPNR